MRRTRLVGGSFLGSLAAAVALQLSCAPAGRLEMTPEQKVARGEALSWFTGCNDCHTPGTLYGAPDTTRLLSGSELGWQGPWGVTYARNLTPDPATGIGDWTEDQIVTAMRAGHRPDGTPILPPMPWQNLSRMPDEDAYALAAYLKSVRPVEHRVPDRLPPGETPTGAVIVFPPPPAWDAPAAPPGGGH